MTEAKLEEFQKTAFICHYDIPSEGFAFLRENSIDSPQEKLMKKMAYTKITSCRVKSADRLHALGLPSSNSVILIPSSIPEQTIDDAITQTEKDYNQLNELLKSVGLPSVGSPYIRKVAIVKFQFTTFKEMAERKLMERLDGAMDTLSKKINEISALADERKKSAVASRYRGELKDIQSMRDLAAQLGINADEK